MSLFRDALLGKTFHKLLSTVHATDYLPQIYTYLPAKMFKTALLATLAGSAVAFHAAPVSRLATTKLSMSAEGLAGVTAPLGYFDPLGKHNIHQAIFNSSQLKIS